MQKIENRVAAIQAKTLEELVIEMNAEINKIEGIELVNIETHPVSNGWVAIIAYKIVTFEMNEAAKEF